MEVDAHATLKEELQREDAFLQVVNIEKQLLTSIHTKCLLHKDVQELYHQVRSGYESIILNDHDIVELQEVEHLLWKLHYKHIDEFRKSIRVKSTGGDSEVYRNISRHIEGFKSFLSEAAEFYQNLIKRFRELCGLPGELFIDDSKVNLKSTDSTKLSKCHFTCHRFLVCLGDISRYSELFKKQDASKWYVAFTYYIEASRICHTSGNPHNQLALLARYVNDSFLALYHCTRSLAVKEPFPDAWNNLILLFEEIKPSQLTSFSNEKQLDLLKPYQKISLELASKSDDGSSNAELWPLFVRLISLFLGRSSVEEFPCMLSLVVIHLEALVQLDDEQLVAAFESFKLIDSSRKGPFRALQFVSVYIFLLHSLSGVEKDWEKESPLMQLALIATFICIARLVERCTQGNQHECPLLPAVMVFAEWLAEKLDTLEPYATDEKVMCAISYFFSAFTDLLNWLNISEAEIALDKSALWEDHELRGFEPMAQVHISLDFTTHWEWTENLNSKRARRIFHSGMRIANRSNYKQQWICFDRKGRKFHTKEPHEEKDSSASTEDEEVILFKPIIRHNSEPLHKYTNKEDFKEPGKSSDECLLRATSMFQSRGDPLRYNKPVKQQDAVQKESSPAYPTGPPSLSAWVFDKENSNYELGKGIKSFNKLELCPIQEVAAESLASLLLDTDSVCVSTTSQNAASTYVAPVPSAPMLPDDATWCRANSQSFVEYNSAVGSREASAVSGGGGILGAAPIGVYPNVSAPYPHIPLDHHFSPPVNLPGLVHGYPPVLGMSSSEWLYHYRNNHKLEPANYTHIWPVNYNGHTSDISSRFDLFNQWENPFGYGPAFYMESPQLHHPGSSLVYGMDERKPEQPLLLQYLKEKEWQLHSPQLRGSTFLGN